MKIKVLSIISVLVACILSGTALAPASAATQSAPIAVKALLPDGADGNEILAARFLNMLNHNFTYGEDFKYIDEIINLSTIALLDSADEKNPEYIKESIVFDYIYDMYGIEIDDASDLNAEYSQKDGYIYIIPRGYTVYNHTNVSVSVNADGSYMVTTDVKVSGHDTPSESCKAVSLFVRNENSSFGFSLISSEIYDSAVQM